MSLLALPLLLLTFITVELYGQSGAERQDLNVVTALTLESFETRVQAMGFECSRGKDDKGKDDTYFIFRAQGYKVAAFVPSKDVIELDNIFSDAKLTLEQINAWNRDNRFATAYRDTDGNVVLQANLSLGGGVTREGLMDFVTRFRDSVASWAQYVVANAGKQNTK